MKTTTHPGWALAHKRKGTELRFINPIALKWYYSILNLIKKHGLNKKYSPMDFLLFLSEVKKVKINNKWHDAEITKSTKTLLQKFKILPIT